MGLDWKKAFSCEQTDVLGVDIGSSQVKLVELRREGSSYTVTSASVTAIAESGEDGAEEKAAVGQAITDCVRSAEPRTRMAVCGVSGPEVAVRGFKFPALPKEEIEGAVLLEAAQVCPFNIEEGAVDYQLMPDGGADACGVLVAATNKLIKAKARLAKGADLQCVLIDVDGLALLNCFGKVECGGPKGDKAWTAAILNVGSSYTTLAIRGSDGLPFVRDIAYAGNDIIEHIAKRNNVSKEAVRERLFGGADAGSEQAVSQSMGEACRKLVVDVTETLRYWTVQEKHAAVEQIHICGGFATADGFVELLDSQLAARAVLWNPFDKVGCAKGCRCDDIISKKGPSLAVAAGFAMRSI
jgi:type IV pilus assembly protein PilM